MALIAEDLLLLLLDDETGRVSGSGQLQPALGGAVLAELALGGHVEVGEKSSVWRTAKVGVAGGPPAEPVLAEAYAVVAEKPRPAQDLVNRLGKGLQQRLTDDLVARGLLEERKDRVLGVFPRTRWPAADSTHEQEVRRAIEATLLKGQPPEPRTRALIALLSATDQVTTVVSHDGLGKRELKKRAKAVAEGDWAAKGVADAIAATNAAVAAVVASTAATTAATAGS